MCAKRYYSLSNNYPEVIKYITSGVISFMSDLLYPEDTYVDAMKRFVLTDIGEFALKGSADVYNLTNVKFPFTAYTFGDMTLDEQKLNHLAIAGKHYEDSVDATMYAGACLLSIPMISFFARADDYYRATSLLLRANASKSLVTTPILINSISKNIPSTISFEISKGSYAFEFETQLRAGKIYDIVHNVNVQFHDLILDTATSPVDSIELNVDRLEAFFTNSSGQVQILSTAIDSGLVPDTPEVSSTLPVDGATDIIVSYSPTINFNVSMDEDSVKDSLYLNPAFDFRTIWDSGSSGLIIDPFYDLSSGVLYEITLMNSAKSIDTVPMEEDFTFYFTTES